MSIGIEVNLQPRDIECLKYLAWGPARLDEAKQFYKNNGTEDSVSHQALYINNIFQKRRTAIPLPAEAGSPIAV